MFMPEQHPAPILIDRRTIETLYGLSRETVNRLVKEGRLPQPIKSDGSRTRKRRWYRAEIEAAVAAWPRGEAA
jgi:predicted DNA-binding transcriptional regulator AlpA